MNILRTRIKHIRHFKKCITIENKDKEEEENLSPAGIRNPGLNLGLRNLGLKNLGLRNLGNKYIFLGYKLFELFLYLIKINLSISLF